MALSSRYPTVTAFKAMQNTGQWSSYFIEGDPVALEKDFIKVEEELEKGKRAVREQIEKAKVFVDNFAADLAIRQSAEDASPEMLAGWEELRKAYQAENEAAERVQDCCDKYPKTSTMVVETKQKMKQGKGFPELLERLTIVTRLDTERKGLQKVADDAKAGRLEFEKKITAIGANLDPSYEPATRKVQSCY